MKTILLRATLPTTLLIALAGAAAAQEIPTWSACDDGMEGAECATLTRPLDPETPGRGEIDLAMRRVRVGSGDAPTRLWYVAGGPGDAATTALGRLRAVFPDAPFDLYATDHRGTGGSARLTCPQQEAEDSLEGGEIAAAEWPPCIDWLRANRDDLDALTADASVADLAAAIDAMATVPARNFVFGASYGTWLVQRYLRLRPEQPDGVILDGLVPTDWTLNELDLGLASFGERLLTRCAESAECGERLGEDPAALARDVAERFDAGHCPDLNVDGATIRLLLGNLAMGGPEIWPHIPPMIYRLDQCRLRDMLAIGALVENLFESGEIGEDPTAHSPALQRHVALSEMWPVPSPGIAELEAVVAGATMTTSIGPSFDRTRAQWPVYPRPADAGAPPEYEGPALLLHGGMDPTMPMTRLAAILARFDGPAQTFVAFPDRGHVVLNDNPCARSLYTAFIADPTGSLDTSCATADRIDPITFAGDAEPAFGTDDVWGDSLSSLERQAIFLAAATLGVFGATVWFFWRRRRARRANARS